MKSLAVVFVVLVYATNCLAAMTKSGVPELKVWYELVNQPFGSAMSFLAGFDTSHTRSALAIAGNPATQTFTWYNKHPYDTSDRFRWIDSARGLIIPVDLNGDGVTDYYDGSGNVYRGLYNGRPPQNTPQLVGPAFVLRPFLGDYDGDGISDLLFPITDVLQPRSYKNHIGKLVLGNANLDSVRTIDMPVVDDDFQQLVGAFVASDGTPRILALVYYPIFKEGGIALYKLLISKVSGEYVAKYKIIDAYLSHFAKVDEMYGPAKLIYSSDVKEHTFAWHKSVFSLETDKLIHIRTLSSYGGIGRILRNSCAADSILYEFVIQEPDSLGNLALWLAIVKGNPRLEITPFAKVPFGWKEKNDGGLTLDEECMIGDVNGDGVEDYAFHYYGMDDFRSLSRLRLCLGRVEISGVSATGEQ